MKKEQFLLTLTFLILLGSCCLSAQSLQSQQQVTASDYCDFLNHEAGTDVDHLYDQAMGSDLEAACIVRIGEPGSYHYEVIAGRENFPICYVNEVDKEVCDAVIGISSGVVNPIPEDLIKSNRDEFSVFLQNGALVQMFVEPLVVATGASWEEILALGDGVGWLTILGAWWFKDDIFSSRENAPDGKIGEEIGHRITERSDDGDVCLKAVHSDMKGKIPSEQLKGKERSGSIASDEVAAIEEKKSPTRNKLRSSSDLGRSKTPPLSFALGNPLVQLPENVKFFQKLTRRKLLNEGQNSEFAGLLSHRGISGGLILEDSSHNSLDGLRVSAKRTPFSQEERKSDEATAQSVPSNRKERPLFDMDRKYISPATFAADYSPETIREVYSHNLKYSTELVQHYAENRDKYSETDERLFKVLNQHFDVVGKNIFDLGCGDGKHARRLIRMGAKSVIGADVSGDMISLAQQKIEAEGIDKAQFFVADGRDLHKVLSGSQDMVFSNFVLHYFSETDPVFKEIARVLSPGGLVVATFNITDIKEEGLGHLYNTPMPIRLGGEGSSVVVNNLIKDREEILSSIANNGFKIEDEEELVHPNAVIDPSFRYHDKLTKRALLFVLRKVN